MPENTETQARIQSIEALVREAEKIPDPAARSLCRQLVQSVMDLHGAGLERTLEIVHAAGQPGPETIDELGRDPLVRSLLLLYGIHPVDLRTRVLEGVAHAKSCLGSQAPGIEVLHISDAGAVTLRVEQGSHGCGTPALRSLIEDAIYEAAPDATSLVIEGLPVEGAGAQGFVPLTALRCNGTASESSTAPAPEEDARAAMIVPDQSQGSRG